MCDWQLVDLQAHIDRCMCGARESIGTAACGSVGTHRLLHVSESEQVHWLCVD